MFEQVKYVLKASQYNNNNNGRSDSYFTWLATSNEGDTCGL